MIFWFVRIYGLYFDGGEVTGSEQRWVMTSEESSWGTKDFTISILIDGITFFQVYLKAALTRLYVNAKAPVHTDCREIPSWSNFNVLEDKIHSRALKLSWRSHEAPTVRVKPLERFFSKKKKSFSGKFPLCCLHVKSPPAEPRRRDRSTKRRRINFSWTLRSQFDMK